MNQEDTKTPEDKSKAQPTESELSIQKQLTELTEATKLSKAFEGLQGDPDFAALLKLKGEGKSVTIAEKPVENKDEFFDLFKDLNTADPVDVENQNTDDDKNPEKSPKFNETLEIYHKQLSESVMAPLAALTKVVTDMQSERSSEKFEANQASIKSDIVGAVEKHSDIEDYKEDMSSLWDQHPSLSVEQTYLLAKSQRVGINPIEMETERAGLILARPKSKDFTSVRPGSRGFNQMVNDALTNRGHR